MLFPIMEGPPMDHLAELAGLKAELGKDWWRPSVTPQVPEQPSPFCDGCSPRCVPSMLGGYVCARRADPARAPASPPRRVEPSDEPSDEFPWPEPDTPARPARPEEVPPSAKRFAQAASAAGWAVSVTYSRGTTPQGRDGAPGGLVETVSVLAKRPQTRLVGLWRCPAPSPPMKFMWGFEAGFVATPSDGLRKVGSRELTAALLPPMNPVE